MNKKKWMEILQRMSQFLENGGKCIEGPPITNNFPQVPPKDFLSSILSDFQWIRDHVTKTLVYSVLNMCRVLAYTHQGKNLSTKEAADWALRNLPKTHAGVVRSALNIYSSDKGKEIIEEEELTSFAAYSSREILGP